MNSKPLVTIVTPVYNHAEYLEETIESVLAQDYPNIEYIVLDDGSTDSTPEVLARYQDRIVCGRHENMGQSRTQNKGWEMAKGTYLGYLSSDDVLHPTAISKIVNFFETKHDEISCVYPDADLIDKNSSIVKRSVCKEFQYADLIIKQECYIGPGAIFKKSDFDTVGGWRSDLVLAPDREFWMRIGMLGKIMMLNEVLAGYRMHPKQISYSEVSEKVSREYLEVLDNFFDQRNVPDSISTRKNEAYGYANLLVARNRFRALDFGNGWRYYKEACSYHPTLKKPGIKLQLVRNAVSKPLRILLSKMRVQC